MVKKILSLIVPILIGLNSNAQVVGKTTTSKNTIIIAPI